MMLADFDPYKQWLGIPPEEQPPNHYQLLGLKPLEDDRDVIWTAARRQVSILQRRAAGSDSSVLEQLLEELSSARICLLDPDRKAQYDAKLKPHAKVNSHRDLDAGSMPAPPKRTSSRLPVRSKQTVPPQETAKPSPAVDETKTRTSDAKSAAESGHRTKKRHYLLQFVSAVVVAILVFVVVVVIKSREGQDEAPQRKSSGSPPVAQSDSAIDPPEPAAADVADKQNEEPDIDDGRAASSDSSGIKKQLLEVDKEALVPLTLDMDVGSPDLASGSDPNTESPSLAGPIKLEPGDESDAKGDEIEAAEKENGTSSEKKQDKENGKSEDESARDAEEEAKLASEFPKELLEVKGLSDRDGTWLLAEETKLKEHMSRVKLMQKGLKKQIREVTKRDRERVQEMLKIFEKERKEWEEWGKAHQGKQVPSDQVDRYHKKHKELESRQKQLQAALAKIATNEDDIRRTTMELHRLAVEMSKLYNVALEKYAKLQQNPNVAVALQKAKGTLGPSSIHSDAKRVVLGIQKQLQPKK